MELLQNMGIEHPCVQKYDRRYLLGSLSKALGGEDPRSATWAPSCASFPCPVVGVSCTHLRKQMQVGAHKILESSKMLFIDFEDRWPIHT